MHRIVFMLPKHNHAQDKGTVVAGAVGALAAIGTGVAAVEQMKERRPYRMARVLF